MRSQDDVLMRSWLTKTRKMEKNAINNAISEYLKITSLYPLQDQPYNRLMILFRKLRLYKYELMIIEKAIQTFEYPYCYNEPVRFRYMAIVDNRGNLYYDSPRVRRWYVRKRAVRDKQYSV